MVADFPDEEIALAKVEPIKTFLIEMADAEEHMLEGETVEPTKVKKLYCDFSGSFQIDVNDVKLAHWSNEGDPVVKTAAEWLKERGNIDGLDLEDFAQAFKDALDSDFQELDLSIEE